MTAKPKVCPKDDHEFADSTCCVKCGWVPPCGDCGGPYQYDTTIPSALWNRVVRARGGSEYLCLNCIVRIFGEARESFSATLWSDLFNGLVVAFEISGVERAIQEPAPEGDDELQEARRILNDIVGRTRFGTDIQVAVQIIVQHERADAARQERRRTLEEIASDIETRFGRMNLITANGYIEGRDYGVMLRQKALNERIREAGE